MFSTRFLLSILLIATRSSLQLNEPAEVSDEAEPDGSATKKLNINVNVNVDGPVDEAPTPIDIYQSKETIQELGIKLLADRLREKLAKNETESNAEEDYQYHKGHKQERRGKWTEAKETLDKLNYKDLYADDIPDKEKDKAGPTHLSENPHPPGDETDEERYDKEKDEAKAPKMNDDDPFDNPKLKRKFKETKSKVAPLSLKPSPESGENKEVESASSYFMPELDKAEISSLEGVDDLFRLGGRRNVARTISKRLKEKRAQHKLVETLANGNTQEDTGHLESFAGRSLAEDRVPHLRRHKYVTKGEVENKMLFSAERGKDAENVKESNELDNNDNFEEILMTKVDKILSRIRNQSEGDSQLKSAAVESMSRKNEKSSYSLGSGHINQQFLPMAGPELQEAKKTMKTVKLKHRIEDKTSIQHIRESIKAKQKQHNSKLFNDSVLSGENSKHLTEVETEEAQLDTPRLHSTSKSLSRNPKHDVQKNDFDADGDEDDSDDMSGEDDDDDEEDDGTSSSSKEDDVEFDDESLPGNLRKRDHVTDGSRYIENDGESSRSARTPRPKNFVAQNDVLFDKPKLIADDVDDADVLGTSGAYDSIDSESEGSSEQENNAFWQKVQIGHSYGNLLSPASEEKLSSDKRKGFQRSEIENGEDSSGSGVDMPDSGSGRSFVTCGSPIESHGGTSVAEKRCSEGNVLKPRNNQMTWFSAGKVAALLAKKESKKSRKQKHNRKNDLEDIYLSKKKSLSNYILQKSHVPFGRRESTLIPHPDKFMEPRSNVGEGEYKLESNLSPLWHSQLSKKSRSFSKKDTDGLLKETKYPIDSQGFPRTLYVFGNVSWKDILRNKTFENLLKDNSNKGSRRYTPAYLGLNKHYSEKSTMLGMSRRSDLTAKKSRNSHEEGDLDHAAHAPRSFFFSPEEDEGTPREFINTYEVEELYKHGSDASIQTLPVNRDITTPPGGFSNHEDDFYDTESIPYLNGAKSPVFTKEGELNDLEEAKRLSLSSQSKPYWLPGFYSQRRSEDEDDVHEQEPSNEQESREREDQEQERFANEREKYNKERELSQGGSRLAAGENADNEGALENEREEQNNFLEREESKNHNNRNEHLNTPMHEKMQRYHVHGERPIEEDREPLYGRPDVDYRQDEAVTRLRDMEMARIANEIRNRERVLEQSQPGSEEVQNAQGRNLGRPTLKALLQAIQSSSDPPPAASAAARNTQSKGHAKSLLAMEPLKPKTSSLDPSAAYSQNSVAPSIAISLGKLTASVVPRPIIAVKRTNAGNKYTVNKYDGISKANKRSIHDRAPAKLHGTTATFVADGEGVKRSLQSTAMKVANALRNKDDEAAKQINEDDLFLSKRGSVISEMTTENLSSLRRNMYAKPGSAENTSKTHILYNSSQKRFNTKRNPIRFEVHPSGPYKLGDVTHQQKIYKRKTFRFGTQKEAKGKQRSGIEAPEVLEHTIKATPSEKEDNTLVHQGNLYDIDDHYSSLENVDKLRANADQTKGDNLAPDDGANESDSSDVAYEDW